MTARAQAAPHLGSAVKVHKTKIHVEEILLRNQHSDFMNPAFLQENRGVS